MQIYVIYVYLAIHTFQIIDPLPTIDHSEIEYEPFNKNFFEVPDEVERLGFLELQDLRNKLGIRVSEIWCLNTKNHRAWLNTQLSLLHIQVAYICIMVGSGSFH